MKRLSFTIIMLCLAHIGFSQIINTSNTNFNNGLGATKFLNIPNGTTPFATGVLPGSLYYYTSNFKLAVYNGTIWSLLLTENLASTLYKPINGTTAWTDITGKPTFFSGSYTDLTNKPNLSQYYLSTNPAGYISSYTETDPIWSSVASTYRTKTQNDALYQAAGAYLTSESDPTVSPYVKGITDSYFANGETAYTWGNHALAGYITQAVADNRYPLLTGSYVNPVWITSIPYTKITGTPTIPTNNNQLANGAGYITGYTETDPIWSSVAANYRTKAQNDILYQAAGNYYLASNPSGYISSYTETDPLWTAQKVNYSTKAQADALYKPIGYTPDLSAYSTTSQSNALYRPIGYVTTWAELTGKPTTVAGYGITDAYTKTQVDAAIATALPTLVEVSTTTQALTVNRTYIVHTTSLTTLTLPANPAIGSLITIIADGSGMFRVAQNAGQFIVSGNATSTVGTGGYVQTNSANTALTLRFINTGGKWSVTSSNSTPTIN